MGTPLEEEKNTPLKEIHNSILRIHKKIDYIFSLFILSPLFDNLINKLKKEGKNMENKYVFETLDKIKDKNEYQDYFTHDKFTDIENPVIDSDGLIRSKFEPTIKNSLIKREGKEGEGNYKGVTIIESTDLIKVQSDYKRLEDKFDDMTKMFRMMMAKMDEQMSEQKKENQELRNEIRELKNTVSSQNQKIDAQAQEISRLNGVVSEQTREISRLNSVVSEQGKEISRLNSRVEAVESKNQLLVVENKSLKNAQVPVLRLGSVPNKRRKHEEVNESDNENSVNESDLETVPLSPRDAMGRKWNPITGLRDTFSVFTPRRVLLQEKQENALRKAAFGNEISKVKRLLNENQTIVNGRGMPDSLCSFVMSFNDKTPLMLAAQQGNLECVQTLIEAGAVLDLLDRDNFTALDYAQQNQHRDVSVFLMRQKAHNGVDVVEKEGISDKMKLN